MLTTRVFRLRRPGAVVLLLLAAALPLILAAAARPVAAAGSQFTIYDDELAAEWEAVTFRAKADTGAAAPTFAGTRSLSVNYGQGASYVQLRTSIAVYAGSFETLRFAIYGADAKVRSVAVTLYDGLDKPGSGAVIVPVPVGQWSVVEIPLAQLGSPAVIGGIRLTKVGDLRPWSSYYLDDIALAGSGGAPPPATATVTATSPSTTAPPTATVPAPTGTPPTAIATAPVPTATETPPATLPPPTATQPLATATQPLPTTTLPPPTATEPPPTPSSPARAPAGIWISPAEIASLPASGAGWERVFSWAQQDSGNPNISDQNDQTDAVVVAKALIYVKTGDDRYRQEAVAAILAAMGTEDGGNTLALARNLAGYVVAADLVGLSEPDEAAFRSWLSAVRHENLGGRTLISTHEDRPNNWGTHAGVSRMAAAVYLGDTAELQGAATVFRGWLGDRSAYAGFNYGDLSWQSNPSEPVGVNPAGATIQGHDVDGVLPDDQRRAGSFSWPPPAENYVWEALQGAVAQARLLSRQGFDAYNWSDRAILRAVTWLHEEAGFPATGDDEGTPWLINGVYGSGFPAASGARPGKNGLGWYEWFYGG